MNKLTCTAFSCQNNVGRNCSLAKVLVEGLTAQNAQETKCTSYIAKSVTNLNSYTKPNPVLEVKCNAKDCMHNINNLCDASVVNINSMQNKAQCDTFKKS